MKPLARCRLALAAALVLAASASAQATRTWVSGVGDDANPCSRTAPCKTFAGAISRTAAGGEINALDPGGYGAVTITKAITLDGAGTQASILASSVNGVTINITAPGSAGNTVTLRNLSINGAAINTPGTGLNGVRILTGGTVNLENLRIERFTQWGVAVQPNAAAQVNIVDSTISNNIGATGGGVLVRPGAAATATVTLDRVVFDKNRTALLVEDRGKATATDTVASGGTTFGFHAKATAAAAELNLNRCVASNNAQAGIRSEGSLATVRIADTASIDNGAGLASISAGAILSYGDNRIAGNTTNGAPTGSLGLQ
jgi:hypothetical protein